MKKITMFAVLIMFAMTTMIGCTRIGPGYVGIKINLAGDNRGTDEIPITTGWVAYNPFSTSVYEYPTFMQTAIWTKDVTEGSPTNEEITFASSDKVSITADINASYLLTADRVPYFYTQFRSDNLETFTHGYLFRTIRNVFNDVGVRYSSEEVIGAKKAELLNAVRDSVNYMLRDYGVVLDQIGFISAPRLPANVMQAINDALAAQQLAKKAENELKVAEAEAQKKIATAYGEGAADSTKKALQASANFLLNKSLTSDVIEWEKLQILRQWNGQLPTTMVGSETPFIVNMK